MIGDGLFHFLTKIFGRKFQLGSILNPLDSFLCCVCKFCVPEIWAKVCQNIQKTLTSVTLPLESSWFLLSNFLLHCFFFEGIVLLEKSQKKPDLQIYHLSFLLAKWTLSTLLLPEVCCMNLLHDHTQVRGTLKGSFRWQVPECSDGLNRLTNSDLVASKKNLQFSSAKCQLKIS